MFLFITFERIFEIFESKTADKYLNCTTYEHMKNQFECFKYKHFDCFKTVSKTNILLNMLHISIKNSREKNYMFIDCNDL